MAEKTLRSHVKSVLCDSGCDFQGLAQCLRPVLSCTGEVLGSAINSQKEPRGKHCSHCGVTEKKKINSEEAEVLTHSVWSLTHLSREIGVTEDFLRNKK